MIRIEPSRPLRPRRRHAALLLEGAYLPLAAVGAAVWESSRIALPEAARAPRYRHLFTGEWCEASGAARATLPLERAFAVYPVALLWAPPREEDAKAHAA